MPGGKKTRRGKNHTNNMLSNFISPTESQFYAKVIKNNGSCRFDLQVFYYSFENNQKDKSKSNTSHSNIDRNKVKPEHILFKMENKIGSVRGKMMRRNYVNLGDIILVSERDFQASIVDIIHVYKSFHYNNIRKCKFAPPDLFDDVTGDNINFMDESDSDNSDLESNIEYSSRSRNKQKDQNQTNNHDYMATIDLLSQDFSYDRDNEANHSTKREIDAFGNFI